MSARFISRPPRVLTVATESYAGHATWKFTLGSWSCTAAEPALRWMIGKSANRVALTLFRLNASWSWSHLEPAVQSESQPQTPTTAPVTQSGLNPLAQRTSKAQALGNATGNAATRTPGSADKSRLPARRHPPSPSTAMVP